MKYKKLGIEVTTGLSLIAMVTGGIYMLPDHKTTLSAQELADQIAESTTANDQTPSPTAASQTPSPSPSNTPAFTRSTADATRTQTQSANQSSTNGLQVQSGSSLAGLGQDSGNRSDSGGGQRNAASAGVSAAANNPFDPTTFAQYDRYKTDKQPSYYDALKGDDGAATLVSGKKATVYYRGWLTNGTLFDQSRPDATGKMQSFSFTMGAHQVIPGWEQGLSGMKVGGVRLLIVPPEVGYGANGQGSIPANSVLIFQVQLADVQ